MTIAFGELSQPSQGSFGASVSRDTAKRTSLDDQLLSTDVTKNLVEIFRLLADETRLQILYLLQQKGELNVRAICLSLKQSQPAVSHHLALLRMAGLVEMRRDGKHNFYRVVLNRFEEAANMVFAATPEGRHQIRLNDMVISHSKAK